MTSIVSSIQSYANHAYNVAKSDVKSLISGNSLSRFKVMNNDEQSDLIVKVALAAVGGMLLSGTFIATLAAVAVFAHFTNLVPPNALKSVIPDLVGIFHS